MSATYGKLFQVTIFGESHSDAIGVVLSGVPSGITLDFDEIKKEMARRAPGKNKYSTPRAEADLPVISCGVFEGKTTGTPILATILNTNTRSQDYTPEVLRPSTADYSGMVRYKGCNDYRGSGHFSGRLTAPLVFAGAVAKQVLKKMGVEVFAHIKSVGTVEDDSFDFVNPDIETLLNLQMETLPVLNKEKAKEMEQVILSAKENQDSVGGSVEAVIVGVEPGIGSPFFDSVESRISQMIFSVPAVKAVSFGIGTQFSKLSGSEANDAFCLVNGAVKTKTNQNGGINGGITNGMPIVVTATIKPTPSIGKMQDTVNIKTMQETGHQTHGRHDPCIVQRAVPVIEAGLAVSILDMLLEAKSYAGTI